MKVLVVGLGAVTRTHLAVLEADARADVVAGVDVDPSRPLMFRGRRRRVFETLDDVREQHDPDIVVIATPTPSHAQMASAASRCFPHARLLVEKPAAISLSDARHVLTDISAMQPVDVAYHMSYSPEVTWGLQQVRARKASLGHLISAELSFTDAYYDSFDHAHASLYSSWVDSGINALSVLNRFAEITERQSLRQIGTDRESVYDAQLTCNADDSSFPASIITSWHVADPAKTTRLTWTAGAELLLDHTGVAAYLLRDGALEATFGSDSSIPRRERHYKALYNELLSEDGPLLDPQTSLHLHVLLLEGSTDSG